MTRRRAVWLGAVCVGGGIAIGCGGNVVVDSPPSGVGGAGGSATTGDGAGGAGGSVTFGTSTGGGGDMAGGGSLTCDEVLAKWSTTLVEHDFVAGLSYPDYLAMNGCACVTLLSGGGCADVCEMALEGTTTPNFCDGAPALSQCAMCLSTQCAAASAACQQN